MGEAEAGELVRARGTVVLKTTTEAPVTLDLAPVVVNEIRLVGSRCGRFEPALRLLEDDAPPVESMIDARLPLDRAPAALERAAEPGCLKVLIVVNPR